MMAYRHRHISKDMKERALWLISHGYAPEDICELFDISPRSVFRWKQNDHAYGSQAVIPPLNPIQCRPRLLNGDMTHDLYTLLEEAPEVYQGNPGLDCTCIQVSHLQGCAPPEHL